MSKWKLNHYILPCYMTPIQHWEWSLNLLVNVKIKMPADGCISVNLEAFTLFLYKYFWLIRVSF